MPSLMKIVYGSIVALLVLIIATSAINAPDYETAQIKELELTLTSSKTDYTVGESAIVNIYLTNNHPYKVQVTIPNNITHNQVTVNHFGSEVVGITPVNGRDQTIIIESYDSHYLTTLNYTQRRTGRFKIQVRCDNLNQILILNVTSPDSSINYYTEGLKFWIPTALETVNYTGLPAGENVKIYPESHIITGDTFTITYENNRDKPLYWGSYWLAEKHVSGEWVEQNLNWVWPDILYYAERNSTTTREERFPFDDGVYRITKQIMLTDNYDRETHEWVDQFTVTFYIIKTN
ncbi:MAG: hypothetical protein NWF07_14280 [Candidatus Bathyarchaeota archaeon]|nr:hypothetical protein [Candidatus Bathyarchaeota archaeon]